MEKADWITLRSQLRKHLHEMHSGIGLGISPSLSAEQLEKLHELLHIDGYACPPHSHEPVDELEPWVLPKVILTYGDDYAETIVASVRSLVE